jgi:hypothetical protein
MSHITLTDEQVRQLETGTDTVEVHAPDGRVLGLVRRLGALDLEAIRNFERQRGQGGPSIPGERVLALLRKASEIDAQEGMTREKMDELVRRALAGETL